MFWPLSLTWFFVIALGSLLALLILDRYTSGTTQRVIRILLHALSVLFFVGFLWYITTLLRGICSEEITRTVVIAIFLFVLSLVGIFYYIGRRRI